MMIVENSDRHCYSVFKRCLIPNLQTLKFKPKDEDQVEFVKELFVRNDTKIVVVYRLA